MIQKHGLHTCRAESQTLKPVVAARACIAKGSRPWRRRQSRRRRQPRLRRGYGFRCSRRRRRDIHDEEQLDERVHARDRPVHHLQMVLIQRYKQRRSQGVLIKYSRTVADIQFTCQAPWPAQSLCAHTFMPDQEARVDISTDMLLCLVSTTSAHLRRRQRAEQPAQLRRHLQRLPVEHVPG